MALHRVEKFRERIPFRHIEFAVYLEAQVSARLFHFHLVDITDGDLSAQLVQRGRGGQSDSPRATRDDYYFVANLDADGSRVCHPPSTALDVRRRNKHCRGGALDVMVDARCSRAN